MNTPPITLTELKPVEKRQGERRRDWHTPEDCHKLLNVQEAMDAVNKRLDEGHIWMTRTDENVCEIKEQIKANNDAALVHRVKFEATLAQNTAATSEILEIISTAKGFFKGASVIGSGLKWFLGIATAILAFWLTLKGGGSGK